LTDWVKGKGERRLTYKQTAEDVYGLCWALKDIGIKKGNTIASLGFNSVEVFEMVLSSYFLGHEFGCQNPILSED
jgi:acyl-coenzyme A synthetase/AMP-(fatty) acid ligase